MAPFGGKGPERVVAHIRGQREHHAAGTAVERLEQITAEEGAAAPEGGIPEEAR